jgi:hypothetical protein
LYHDLDDDEILALRFAGASGFLPRARSREDLHSARFARSLRRSGWIPP